VAIWESAMAVSDGFLKRRVTIIASSPLYISQTATVTASTPQTTRHCEGEGHRGVSHAHRQKAPHKAILTAMTDGSDQPRTEPPQVVARTRHVTDVRTRAAATQSMLSARARGPRVSPGLMPLGREGFTQTRMAVKPSAPIGRLIQKLSIT
jgi:hypothetical protein